MATRSTRSTQRAVVGASTLLFLILSVSAIATTTTAAATAAAATAAAAAPVCTGKRLVVLAGPRRSATTSVAEFFYKYARGAQPDRQHGKIFHPLAKFRWPLVYGEASNQTEIERPYKRFNHLVTDSHNLPLKEEILQAVHRDWNIPGVDAVILGGEEFDQVGDNANVNVAANNNGKQYDAISAVQDIVDTVGAPPECVTILLNYRVPRFEHWVSLYSSLTALDDTDNAVGSNFLPYNQHMCQDESSALRIQELGTTMNPMYLAETNLKAAGWNDVIMIDMGGVEEYGTDIIHTIGYNILGGKCDDDGRWVKGHIEETITNKTRSYFTRTMKACRTDIGIALS